METLFIETSTLPPENTLYGTRKQILNVTLAGAKNVLATLHSLNPGMQYTAMTENKNQLLYLMNGGGRISLGPESNHEASKGMGVYLKPGETASILAGKEQVTLLQLEVPKIPN